MSDEIIEINLVLVRVQNGLCRVIYKMQNELNQWIYYSLQEEFRDKPLALFRNSRPPWIEPVCKINFKPHVRPIFERPTGDSRIEDKVRQYIDEGLYYEQNNRNIE